MVVCASLKLTELLLMQHCCLSKQVLKIELHRELVTAMDRLLLKHWKLPEGAPLTEPVVKRLICATRFSMMNVSSSSSSSVCVHVIMVYASIDHVAS
jgi:hypothetical protein